MFEDHNSTIYDIIKSASLLDVNVLDELDNSHLKTGKSLANAVIDADLIERSKLLSSIADYLGYQFVDDKNISVVEPANSIVSADIARMYAVVPYAVEGTSLKLLAKDPFNQSIVDDLTFSLNKDITIVICDPRIVDRLIINTYGEENTSIDEILGGLGDKFTETDEEISDEDLADAANHN